MDFIMNKSTSCDDEKVLSGQGLLTIKITPDELKSVKAEIRGYRAEIGQLRIGGDKVSTALGGRIDYLKGEIKELKEKLIEKSKAHLQLLEIDLLKTKENETLKEENKKLKEHLNSLLTEEQKDIIKGEGLINPENAIYCPDDLVKRIQSFLKERDELAEENVQLNDDDWVITYHKALKYKCVLDEDYYLQHLDDEGQLIDPDEFNALQEENKKLKEDLKDYKELDRTQSKFNESLLATKAELMVENKKLKEENEKIGELVISQTDKLKEVSIKYNEGYKINQELKEEIEKLRSSAKRRQQWFQCLMDCRDNPDNPDKQEIDEWCDAYNKSKKVRKELYEDFHD